MCVDRWINGSLDFPPPKIPCVCVKNKDYYFYKA